MQTILITGITGLIGKYFADFISPKNEFKIRGQYFSKRDISYYTSKNIEMVQADICQAKQLENICKNIDIVVHSAARVMDYGTKQQFYEAHYDATKYILEDAIKNNVQHFVYISSFGPATYINRKNGLPNETVPLVKSGIHYDDAKIDTEELVKQYAKKYNIKYTIIRPSAVIGEDSVWVREPLLRIQKSKLGVVLVNNGKNDACLIDARNLAYGLYLVITNVNAINQTYFFMDDWQITWKQFFTDLLAIVNKKPSINLPKNILLPIANILQNVFLKLDKKPPFSPKAIIALGFDRRVDNSKAKTDLNWKSIVTYNESMELIKKWILKNPNLIG